MGTNITVCFEYQQKHSISEINNNLPKSGSVKNGFLLSIFGEERGLAGRDLLFRRTRWEAGKGTSSNPLPLAPETTICKHEILASFIIERKKKWNRHFYLMTTYKVFKILKISQWNYITVNIWLQLVRIKVKNKL